MKRIPLILTAAFVVSSLINPLNAQTDKINVITTAVPFLRISPDARAGGMGELGIATSPDANAAFYNLAKTPFSKYETGIGLTYTPWLQDLGLKDVYLLAGTGYHKLDQLQALTASIRYFSLGSIQFTDYTGAELGVGHPNELAADLGYSRKLSDKIGIGLTIRYIYSNLASGNPVNGTIYNPGTAVAADLSFYYDGVNDQGEGWRLGAALSNLGTKIGYTNDASSKEFIPANFGIGGSYSKVFDEQNKLSFGLDVNKLMVPTAPTSVDNGGPIDSANLADYHDMSVVSSWFKSFGNGAISFSGGLEYGYNDQFFLRAGYFYEGQSQGDRQYFTLGIGLKYNIIGLNFSYIIPSGSGVTRNPLSNTIRFGLVFDIEGSGSSSGGK